ncbi:hypothetical protein E2320_009695, partial [Naja naja]
MAWRAGIMYCLQWLLPVLLIPKPLNPALWFSHSMFMGFYLLSFLLERKPCTICALVFLAALFLICYSCWGNCFLYHCSGSQLPDSAHDPNLFSHLSLRNLPWKNVAEKAFLFLSKDMELKIQSMARGIDNGTGDQQKFQQTKIITGEMLVHEVEKLNSSLSLDENPYSWMLVYELKFISRLQIGQLEFLFQL